MTEPASLTTVEETLFTVSSSRPLTDDEVEMVKTDIRKRAEGRFRLIDESSWVVSPRKDSIGGRTLSPMFTPGYIEENRSVSKHETHYLYVGEYRRMLEYGRERRIPTRALIWAGGGGEVVRGLTGPIHVIVDTPPEHILSPREDQAVYTAAVINKMHRHTESARTEDIYNSHKGGH